MEALLHGVNSPLRKSLTLLQTPYPRCLPQLAAGCQTRRVLTLVEPTLLCCRVFGELSLVCPCCNLFLLGLTQILAELAPGPQVWGASTQSPPELEDLRGQLRKFYLSL